MISISANANAIADSCKRDVRSQTAARAKLKKPEMTAQNISKAIDGGAPAAEYVVQSDTAVCVADKMKLALDSTSNFQTFCFMAKAKTRIECFQAWQQKQEIAYAKQVVQLAQSALELAKKDMSTPNVDLAKTSAATIDVWLSGLERYSIIKNVAFKPGSDSERDQIRKQEMADFEKARKAVLALAEEEWKSLNALSGTIPKEKVENVKMAKAELTTLKARIVKLKSTKK